MVCPLEAGARELLPRAAAFEMASMGWERARTAGGERAAHLHTRHAQQAGRAAPKVAFGALVENGLIPPGTRVFDKQRRWTATVRADGSLAYEKQTGSIHGLGKDLQGAPSCNGWTFWHFEQGGEIKPIDAARKLYLLAAED